MTVIDSLTALTCKTFSRHIAMGVVPLEGGLYSKLQFWIHWAICPFCRRYWKELEALGQLQRLDCERFQTADVKRRLKENLVKKAS